MMKREKKHGHKLQDLAARDQPFVENAERTKEEKNQ